MTNASHILDFLSNLALDVRLPKGVSVMNPYQDTQAWALCEQFYTQYFSDNHSRVMILGINPGRFGGGITGIPFTDPVTLERECGISNSMKKRTELSAEFIYQMINRFGGPVPFYAKFYISALSPLGFTSGGKNLNYYDDKVLEKKVTPFIAETLRQQVSFGFSRKVCFCLGEGKNFSFLSRLNAEHHFFETIIPLAHPRFIMQYRRKSVEEYIDTYYRELTTKQDLLGA